MNITAVAMVKDEADVIGDTIRHLASEGVDRIAILDNRSTDGTRQQIIEAGNDVFDGCLVTVLDDPETGYYQSRKITALLEHLNAEYDVGWVVPFDADELWHAQIPLAEFFGHMPHDIEVVDARLLSHFASDTDDASKGVFERFEWRDPEPGSWPKVAFRYEPGSEVAQGNHAVTYRNRGPSGWSAAHLGGSTLTVRHFPYRSEAQMIRKVRNGAAAYAATDLPEGTGLHWRRMGRLHDDVLADIFRSKYTFADPENAGQVHDPAPFCRWSR